MKPLEDLLEIAKSATQGEWLLQHEKMKHWENDILANCEHCKEEPFVLAQLNRAMDNWKSDAKHIATFNPKTVIDLITQLKDAQGEIEKLSTAIAEQFERLQVLRLTNESLDNDIEQLEVRNKWLEDRFDHVFIGEIEQRLTECEEVVNEYANMNGYYDRPDEARQYLAKWGVK